MFRFLLILIASLWLTRQVATYLTHDLLLCFGALVGFMVIGYKITKPGK